MVDRETIRQESSAEKARVKTRETLDINSRGKKHSLKVERGMGRVRKTRNVVGLLSYLEPKSLGSKGKIGDTMWVRGEQEGGHGRGRVGGRYARRGRGGRGN